MLQEEITGGDAWGLYSLFSVRALNDLKQKIKVAADMIYDTSGDWKRGDLSAAELKTRVKRIYDTLYVEKESLLIPLRTRFLSLDDAYKYRDEYIGMLKKFYNLHSSIGKEPATEQVKVGPNLKKYRATLTRLINYINKSQDKLIYALGRGNYEKGSKYAEELLTWAQSELNKPYNEIVANREHRRLWNLVIKPFLGGNINVASFANSLMKLAEVGELSFVGKEPARRPAEERRRGRGRGRGRKDPDIGRLQETLAAAGYNPGKIDQEWGKNTAEAFNKMLADYGQARGRQMPTFNRREKPSKNAINYGIYVARQMERADVPKGKFFVLVNGKEVNLPLAAVNNPSALVNALSMANVIKTRTPEEAVKVLVNTYRALNESYIRQKIDETMDPNYGKIVENNKNLLNMAYTKLKPLAARKQEKPTGQMKGDLIDPWAKEKAPSAQKPGQPSSSRSASQEFRMLMGRLPNPRWLSDVKTFINYASEAAGGADTPQERVQATRDKLNEYIRTVGMAMNMLDRDRAQLEQELGRAKYRDYVYQVGRVSRALDGLRGKIR